MSRDEVVDMLAEMDRHREEARKEQRDWQRALRKEFRDLILRVEQRVIEQNSSIKRIDLERAKEAGARDEVARAAALVKATKEERQKSLRWKITAAGIAAASIGGVATAAGVLAQLVYHH